MDAVEYVERWRTHSKFLAIEAMMWAIRRYRGTLVGCENTRVVFWNEAGDGAAYFSRQELDTSAEVGLEFLSSRRLVAEHIRMGRDACRDYTALARSIYRGGFEHADGGCIAKTFRRLFELLGDCQAFYRISAPEFSVEAERRVRNELQDQVDDVERVFQVLTASSSGSLGMSRERRDWAKLLQVAASVSAEKVPLLLQRHAKRYGYLGASGGNPLGWSQQHLAQRLSEDRNGGLGSRSSEADDRSAQDAARQCERREHLCRLRLSSLTRTLIANISKLRNERMRIREAFTQGAFWSNPLFQATYRLIEKTAGEPVGLEILRQLTIDEITDFCQLGRQVDITRLAERYGAFCYMLRDDSLRLHEGRRARAQFASLPIIEVQAQHLLQGTPACSRGTVCGRARIIDSAKHSSEQHRIAVQMAPGEVLVTGMTHPYIMLACEKASAIVTDEGGVTCHAAIIARELGIPCVVNTGNATRAIQTGDCLRVDSERGTVEVVEPHTETKGDRVTERKARKRTRSSAGSGNVASDQVLVRWVCELSRHDVGSAGGKAARLGDLSSSFRVPRGFCITTAAYEAFIEAIGEQRVLPLLSGATRDDDRKLRRVSAEMQRSVLATAIPSAVQSSIQAYCESLGAPLVAVRSSGSHEDSATSSAAGQHLTLLGVAGHAAVAFAVKQCYASMFSLQSLQYMLARSIPLPQARLAVLVQELVDASVAGVMFTLDPVSGRRDRVIVEATYGLGELLVNGTISPDRFVVSRDGLKVVEQFIGSKKWIARAHKGSGTRNTRVRADLRQAICLSPHQVSDLARNGLAIERHLGGPQDIEWAIDARGDIHILQARPITATA